jgi:hypothetical protein
MQAENSSKKKETDVYIMLVLGASAYVSFNFCIYLFVEYVVNNKNAVHL